MVVGGIHVLGIETSCDDTAVAVVGQNGDILSNCVDSQLKRHLHHGGIIPVVAKDYHMESIDRIAKEAFKKSGLRSVAQDIDAIAVATRPGLQFSLQVGLNYAKKLALKYSKPLIPIHHMQAHSLMPLLNNRTIKFPYLTLLISGGHCLLAIANRYNKFDLLGTSRDDAPGDLLDKVGRRLKLKNLGHPYDHISGGASIEMLASKEGADRFKYFHAVPMSSSQDCDFSFGGYRAGFDEVCPIIDELWLSGNRETLITELSHLCSSLQRVMLVQMARKVQRAYLFYRMRWRYANSEAFANKTQNNHLGFDILDMNDIEDTIDLVISGGVAANSYFVNGLKLACTECIDSKIKVFSPSKELCSDNGVMIAWNGLLRYIDYLENKNGFDSKSVAPDESILFKKEEIEVLDIRPQSSIGNCLKDMVKRTNFQKLKLNHPELKVIKKV